VTREQILFDDYKLKVDYLKAHYTRMLTRSTFFLTIDSALLGFSFHPQYEKHLFFISVFGIILSAIWFLFGAGDNYLARLYRNHAESTFYLLMAEKETDLLASNRSVYSFAGNTDIKKFLKLETGCTEKTKRGWLHFRVPGFGPTELVAVVPLLFVAAWLIRLIQMYICH
jgi:hypothetical protein